MTSRRSFIKTTGTVALSSLILPKFATAPFRIKDVGLQLYSVRKEMLAEPMATLKALSKIGYRELESAKSQKGNYYGLEPKMIRRIAADLGMTIRSGHVQIDNEWQKSVDQAAEAGQSYLICSTLPSRGQTVENYQRCAETFNRAAEDCKKVNILFGYHNHEEEFEKEKDQVLYDVLLDRTDPHLVKMELDLGWLIATGNDAMAYFKKYPGRFPLWHLKDMDLTKKQSTEFGKGGVNIKALLDNAKLSGMRYFFVEQEEYTHAAMESVQYDYEYLMKL